METTRIMGAILIFFLEMSLNNSGYSSHGVLAECSMLLARAEGLPIFVRTMIGFVTVGVLPCMFVFRAGVSRLP